MSQSSQSSSDGEIEETELESQEASIRNLLERRAEGGKCLVIRDPTIDERDLLDMLVDTKRFSGVYFCEETDDEIVAVYAPDYIKAKAEADATEARRLKRKLAAAAKDSAGASGVPAPARPGKRKRPETADTSTPASSKRGRRMTPATSPVEKGADK